MPRRLIVFALAIGASMLLCGSAMADFGFESFDVALTNRDGSVDTQAGSHPFQMTTSFSLKTKVDSHGKTVPDEDIKDINVSLPPGLVGSATAVPQCSQEQLTTGSANSYNTATCSDASQVGIIGLKLSNQPTPVFVPIYNVTPPPGAPAEFGFAFTGVPVVLIPTLRTGGDYGLDVESADTSQALAVYAVYATIWGVPGDSAHDGLRGACLSPTGGSTGAQCPAGVSQKPLLTLPSACSDSLLMMVHADSWQEPKQSQAEWAFSEALSLDDQGNPLAIDGCGLLDFSPSVTLQPDNATADSPAGLNVDLSLPQSENPEGLAESDVRKVVMTLPPGMSASPSAVDGLEACTEAQIGLHSAGPAECPAASKIGKVKVESPLLEQALEGGVFVAKQRENPYESLLALYLAVEGAGVRVKLAGGVRADQATGQLTATFEERPGQHLSFPQLPFGRLKLTLYGGPRAALVTPQGCGAYQAVSLLTPWSSEAELPTSVSSAFAITSGCESTFAPSLVAGTTSNQAGGFSPLTVTLARADRDQDFREVTVKTPPGLLGMLSKVPLCQEPQAAAGTCPAVSQIGHVTVAAGAGPDPVSLPQPGRREDPVYLTGPYAGAPFGLSIVAHAEAGPFDLGQVIVRSAISVDPHTAQAIVRSGPIPQILEGIPLQLKILDVVVDRPGFIFNPTNCSPLTVTGTAVSAQGASAPLSSRFQAANCASLPFKPRFAVSTQARTSKARGASLRVKVTSSSGQANIGKVKVDLPKQLPSRLTTLQKACLDSVFEVNPAACPSASLVGTATARTPVLAKPLTGPAYLVSHGGAAFPDLVVVLQGEGVTLDLDGQTDIKRGITSSEFRSVPDAPIDTFELALPEGPHSALTTNLPTKAKGRLCGQHLVMPTAIVGQNGAMVRQSTKIAVTGCPRSKRARKGKGKS